MQENQFQGCVNRGNSVEIMQKVQFQNGTADTDLLKMVPVEIMLNLEIIFVHYN